jgi:hypothetical protein
MIMSALVEPRDSVWSVSFLLSGGSELFATISFMTAAFGVGLLAVAAATAFLGRETVAVAQLARPGGNGFRDEVEELVMFAGADNDARFEAHVAFLRREVEGREA